MTKTLSRFFALFFALQPAFASAAFATPSALQEAIMNDGSARSFSGEMHGSFAAPDESTVYFSAWTNGEQAGTDVRNNSFNTKITVDISVPSANVKMRTKLQMRKVQASLFVQLQSVDATFEDDLNTLDMAYVMKKWIEIPLSEEYISMLEDAESDNSMIDEVLTMEKTKTRSGYSYSLRLQEAFLDELFGSIMTDTPNVHIKVDTNSVDQFLFGKAYLSAHFSSGDGENSIVVTGSSQRMNRALVITAPKDAIAFETLAGRYPQAFHFTGSPLDLLDQGYDDTDTYEEYMEEDDSMTDDDYYYYEEDAESSSDEDSVSDTNQRPSRRTLLEQQAEKEARRLREKLPSSSSSTSGESSSSLLDSYRSYSAVYPGSGLAVGSLSAPITIVEMGDYECPFCAKFHKETFPLIKKNYIDTGKVRFVFRNYPLSFHENAMYAANIVECARDLDRNDDAGWKVHHAIFDSVSSGRELSRAGIESIVRETTGQYAATVLSCALNEEKAEVISNDIKIADFNGISGTPAFWVLTNNSDDTYGIMGAQPYSVFEELLNAIR